jgi:hypothetical protein
MARLFQFAAALIVVLSPAWCDDQATKEPAKPAPKGTPRAPNVNVPGRGAGGGGAVNPRGGVPKPPPIILRPLGPQIQRFLRMTPQEREIFIDKQPIPQQERFRKAVERWESLPPEERERELKLYDFVAKLPKDKQDLVNQRVGEYNDLPPGRKIMIRNWYQRLSALTEADRETWLDRPEFKERFTPIEQQIVRDLVTYYPNPEIK